MWGLADRDWEAEWRADYASEYIFGLHTALQSQLAAPVRTTYSILSAKAIISDTIKN